MKRQSGFSLMEIMIALTVGLILIAGTAQMFMSSKESFNIQEGLGKMQDTARTAMFFLQRDIRMAGYPRVGGPPAFNAATTLNGASGAADQITVQFQSRSDCLGQRVDPNCPTECPIGCPNADGTTSTGVACSNGVSSLDTTTCCPAAAVCPATCPVTNSYVRNTYSLDTTSTQAAITNRAGRVAATGRLLCTSDRITAGGTDFGQAEIATNQPILEGVEALQLLYGVDTVAPLDNFADQYVTADRVTVVGGLNGWNRVVSVRVGLLASSLEGVEGVAVSQRYVILDGAAMTFNDALRRRVFTSTVEVRNRTP